MNNPEDDRLRDELRQARSTIVVQRVVLIFLVVLVTVSASFYLGRKSADLKPPEANVEPVVPAAPAPIPEPEEEAALPPEEKGLHYENGQIMMHAYDFDLEYPLTVTVPDTAIFYVLVDYASQKSDMAFMVEPGGTAEVLVPEGWARIYYACGNAWHGNAKLFGDSTVCFQTMNAFSFHDDGENKIGYTIELIAQEGGNLSSSQISVEEFRERMK